MAVDVKNISLGELGSIQIIYGLEKLPKAYLFDKNHKEIITRYIDYRDENNYLKILYKLLNKLNK